MLCDIFNDIKYSDLVSSAALIVSGASFFIEDSGSIRIQLRANR